MPRPYLDHRGLACFAHRGGAALWPENTMEAFRAGVEAGCPYIETDVHMTRDGHIVCFHDHDLRRTTDGRGPICALSLAELERLDAGYHFRGPEGNFPHRGEGLRVPTLDEVLELGPEIRVNVEIKQRKPPMAEALWRFIEARGVHDRVLVACAESDGVREFRNLARGTVATSAGKREVMAFLLAARAGLVTHLPVEYDALQVPVRAYGLTVVDATFVEAAHQRGLDVHVWTVDDEAQMARLIELKVDGLMSDYPARLVRVARRMCAIE